MSLAKHRGARRSSGRRKPPNYCASGKARYSDQGVAWKALAKINENGGTPGGMLTHVYRCKLCKGHHLTKRGER